MALLAQTNVSHKFNHAVMIDTSVPMSEEEFKQSLPTPAKEYPFELDIFQKQAVLQIEKGNNVFVAAHTSAGKTVVAEYAIALSFKNKTRVIYTSPIKALSNQKYRDLKQEFGNVGIITGDVQLNADAPCLIMTTEILLQMLYINSEEINDLEFVIFDECHYVNDSKRGHVWEEVFILLPAFVKLVLLSATVPNVIEFSDWLGRTRQNITYVVTTNKRPVPLKHYFYLGRDGKTFNQHLLVLEGDGAINMGNFERALDIMKERKAKFGFIKRTRQTERNVYLNLIRFLQQEDKLPVICFTLSRKKCDDNLEMLLAIKEENMRLTNKSESFHIRRFVRRHLKNLKESDLKLEQVQRVSTMLERGFGVHHSGVLPILKELTEILFSSGLVKVLFATETFAMGVNMPARSVVFDSLQKHDGFGPRILKASEYIQMAGRAGRRGKDLEGTVLILCKYEVPSIVDCSIVMKGKASLLESQFRLTYHMILNMLKSNTSTIENFLNRSYREHSKVLSSTGITTQIENIQNKIEQMQTLDCEDCLQDIGQWYNKFETFRETAQKLMPMLLMKASDKKLLNCGRIVVFYEKEELFRLGLVLKTSKSKIGLNQLTILTEAANGQVTCTQIEAGEVFCLLSQQIKGVDANEIIQESTSKASKNKFATDSAAEKLRATKLNSGIPLLLHSVNNFVTHDKLGKFDLDDITKAQNYTKSFKELGASQYNCLKCDQFIAHFISYQKRSNMNEEMEFLSYKNSADSLELLPEYQSRIKVLQQLQFLDEHLVLMPKGHIASSISDNELLITEIVFENLLGNLSDEAIPAILSCFVFESKKQDECDLGLIKEIPELLDIIKKIGEIGLRFGEIEFDEHVEECKTHFIDSLNFDCVRSVYEWAKEKSFLEIMTYTTVQEGILVRCIQRTDELIKNIRLAAKKLESKEFEAKLERSSKLIRRDIVFTPSLYTAQETVQVVPEDSNVANGAPPVAEDKNIVVAQMGITQRETIDGPQEEEEEEEATEEDEDGLLYSDEFFNYNFHQDDTDGALPEEQFSSNFL